MNVGELKKILNKYDNNTKIVIIDDNGVVYSSEYLFQVKLLTSSITNSVLALSSEEIPNSPSKYGIYIPETGLEKWEDRYIKFTEVNQCNHKSW